MNEKEITILIVDDSEAIRILVNAYLREGGYRVLEACNGKEGLEVCKQESIDLALLDIAMPEMDGFSYAPDCKEIHGYNRYLLLCSLPVEMLNQRCGCLNSELLIIL